MKKFLLVLMALVMIFVVSVFGKTTITIWSFFGGGEGYIITDLINRFNAEHPDIEVKEQLIEWGEHYNKLLTAILAGDPPDIAVMHLAVLPDYAQRNALIPLNDYISEDLLKDYIPEIINKAFYEGKLYAIPIDTHPMVLYYNNKLLKELGLKVPKTWDELIEYAKMAKEKLGLENPVTFETGAMLGERLFIAVYSQIGGKFYDEKTGKILLDVDIATKAYELLKRMFDEGVAQVMDYPTAESLFQNNKSLFHINGVWAMAVYPTLEGFDFGVTSIPSVKEGTPPYTWADSHTWVLPKKPKVDKAKVKAAATFLEWFVDHTYDWAKAGHLPVIKTVLNSEEFLSLPKRKDYADVVNYVVPAPSVRGWSEMRNKMWDLGQAVILGEVSPSDAAKELLNTIKQIIEE